MEQTQNVVHQQKSEPTQIHPLLVTVDEAASALRTGRTKLYSLMRDGILPHVKIGKRRLIVFTDLIALVERLKAGQVTR